MISSSRFVFLVVVACAWSPKAWSQLPDLRVLAVDDAGVVGNWQSLVIGGPLAVQIENAGNVGAGGAFDVVAFQDENGNGTYQPGTDTLLGSRTLPDLAAGAQPGIVLSVAGQVRFRENLIVVAIDPLNAIAESDESNNARDSGHGCEINPPGTITPVLQWSWTSSSVQPTSLNVMMTPGVIDVNGDGIPDVIFGSTASTGGSDVEVGILRALDGASGSEIWNVTDPTLQVNTAYNIAIGDIDNDGLAEIVAGDTSGIRLVCFENDGTFKWRSPALAAQAWGGASIADLDADGNPEIITGRQVLDSNGNVLWTGTGGSASGGKGPLSLVCDFDLNGVPDVVAGNTVYTAAGGILCQNVALPDGYNAVANFDVDPEPEAVLVSGGTIRLIERDPGNPASASTVWGPHNIPGGGFGGPPTVADYDGDGLPEVGVAGATSYVVYEHDGTFKWAATIQDSSSNRTGSSVFDFNGDGAAEVVYRDERFLRVYAGATGVELFSVAMSSCTWHEYVMVADVDADGNAEIIACANNNCGFGPQRGIFVFKDANDGWVPTRRIWNQHTYHVTNVEEDGSIPLVESNNWQFPSAKPFNSYRQNTLSTSQPNAAPDLTASRIQFMPPLTLAARVGNGGASFVGTGIPVSFYDGPPGGGGNLLGTVPTTKPLAPGEFEDVSLTVASVPAVAHVVADDTGAGSGLENECDEANNEHAAQVLPPPVTYCTPKPGLVCGPNALAFSGSSSASATSGFTISSGPARGNQLGVLLYTKAGRAVLPFPTGGHILCLQVPVRRGGPANSGGTPGGCDGRFILDMNTFASGNYNPPFLAYTPAAYLLSIGQQIDIQWWGRDSVATGSYMSDGLEYFVGP